MKFISNTCIRWVSLVSLTFIIWEGYGQTIHISHCMASCPQGSVTNTEIVVHHLYAAEINNSNGLADWVAYQFITVERWTLPFTCHASLAQPKEPKGFKMDHRMD